ncbi:MAG TPA: tetratricopeptide repeat protein [Candidatus Obscuribacterales bacterium]
MVYETVWQTYLEVGSVALQAGQMELADRMLEAAIELAKSQGSNKAQTAEKLCVLARTYSAHKRVRRALAIFKEALSIFEELVGLEHANTLATLEAIAQIYVAHGKLNKAIPYYERAARVDEKNVREDGRGILVRMLTKLAWSYYTQGKFAQSAQLYERAESMPLSG